MKIRNVNTATTLLARITAAAVLLSLSAFQFTYLANLHLHILPDGRVVTHSHPTTHDDNDNGAHHHSQYEYAFLNAMGKILQVNTCEADCATEFIDPPQLILDIGCECIVFTTVSSSTDKRAPPALQFV